MDVALRGLQYLKQSPRKGIILSSTSDLHICGYCGVDWGNCLVTHRSVIDPVLFLRAMRFLGK